MPKNDLFSKIQNLSINETKIDRFPPEIDELSLILSQELQKEISESFDIKLSLNEWSRLKSILQVKLSDTIRRTKFTKPIYTDELKESQKENKPKQGYNLGNGDVTIGTEIIYFPPGERAISGIVTDLTQDGDVTIKPYYELTKRISTKWRYVQPKR